MFWVIHDVTDFNQLQEDINCLVTWADKWLLLFNISKCHLLHHGKPHHHGTYNIQGNLILPSESVKDLGVIIDDKLKFHDHVTSVTAKASRTLVIIKSTSISQVVVCSYINMRRPIRVWDVSYACGTILCPIHIWAFHMRVYMHDHTKLWLLHALQASFLYTKWLLSKYLIDYKNHLYV